MPGLLRSVWDEPRPAQPPRRVWRDWALVGVLVPAAVLEGVLRADIPWRPLSVAITVGLIPTLLWRRTRPLLMVAIAFGVTAFASLATGADVPSTNVLVFVLLLAYALFRWGSGREIVIGSVIMLARLAFWMVFFDVRTGDAVGGLAILFGVCALGAAFRYRSRARMREIDQVKLRERERLARDLHDTVAHHVSAMAVRAQAGLATAPARPEAATEALHVIEAEAARALAEMRAMVRVLRAREPADTTPSPTVSDLVRLAGRDGAGPPVDVEVDAGLDDLPPAVGTALFYLAQEAITNARRHARHATRIQVRVVADGHSVRLRVTDDGEARPAASSGYGLIGMIERADLLGGTCEAGPNTHRGWTVTAVLPRTGAPA